jgi:hypothetical protein
LAEATLMVASSSVGPKHWLAFRGLGRSGKDGALGGTGTFARLHRGHDVVASVLSEKSRKMQTLNRKERREGTIAGDRQGAAHLPRPFVRCVSRS